MHSEIINQLNELINSNPSYEYVNGLQLLETYTEKLIEKERSNNIELFKKKHFIREDNHLFNRYVKQYVEDERFKFIDWLKANYSFNRESSEYLYKSGVPQARYYKIKDQQENSDLYFVINYFIQNNTFNYKTAIDWLADAKKAVLNDIDTTIEKEKITTQKEISHQTKRLDKLTSIREAWEKKFNDYTDGGYFYYYNPIFEKKSIENIIRIHKASKKNSVVFRLPIPPSLKIIEDGLPKSIFKSIVTPVLLAKHLIDYLDHLIDKLNQPNQQVQQSIKPLVDISLIHKFYAQYKKVMPKDIEDNKPIEFNQFEKLFYPNAKSDKPLIPTGKGTGHKGDIFTPARHWLKKMLDKLKKERDKDRCVNFNTYTEYAFGIAYSKIYKPRNIDTT